MNAKANKIRTILLLFTELDLKKKYGPNQREYRKSFVDVNNFEVNFNEVHSSQMTCTDDSNINYSKEIKQETPLTSSSDVTCISRNEEDIKLLKSGKASLRSVQRKCSLKGLKKLSCELKLKVPQQNKATKTVYKALSGTNMFFVKNLESFQENPKPFIKPCRMRQSHKCYTLKLSPL